MEEDKLIESKKILTDYMLELNNDIQSAEDWVNTGADEEMYFALKTVLNELERLQELYKQASKCLHCSENLPLYCEKCQQDLITKNAELQLKYEVFIETNYIPKTVIRDRITDLEEVKSKYKFLIGTSYRADGAINTLKELLGDE